MNFDTASFLAGLFNGDAVPVPPLAEISDAPGALPLNGCSPLPVGFGTGETSGAASGEGDGHPSGISGASTRSLGGWASRLAGGGGSALQPVVTTRPANRIESVFLQRVICLSQLEKSGKGWPFDKSVATQFSDELTRKVIDLS